MLFADAVSMAEAAIGCSYKLGVAEPLPLSGADGPVPGQNAERAADERIRGLIRS